MPPRPIETRYTGYRSRSRLEARWAVFFDAMGIPYQYESEGFDLDGLWYLPDFFLLEQGPRIDRNGNGDGVWFEVKPDGPAESDSVKAWALTKATDQLVYIGLQIPEMVDARHEETGELWKVLRPEVWMFFHFSDRGKNCCLGDVFWSVCPQCGHVDLTRHGRANFLNCGCLKADAPGYDYAYAAFHPRLLAAYDAARSARFEFGESGRS